MDYVPVAPLEDRLRGRREELLEELRLAAERVAELKAALNEHDFVQGIVDGLERRQVRQRRGNGSPD